MNEVSIKPLSEVSDGDFLHFFDYEAFVDNPHWAGCYCQFYLTDHHSENWEKLTAKQNRAAAEEKIKSGVMRGYLAFLDGKVVGWCHAGPRSGFAALVGDPEIGVDDEDKVGSIVCFIVSPGERGNGIATKLLEAACKDFKEKGLELAEGYPRVEAASQAANYHGPQKMYEQAGFTVHRSFPNYRIMRKNLRS